MNRYYNKYYNYKYKELWGEHAWDVRLSPLVPLTRWIGEKNIELNRISAKPENERRTEGIFDPKANALSYPEVLEYWENRGLHYHCTDMSMPWIAMIPVEHMQKQHYDDDMDTVVVLTNADHSDPSWCMYTLEKYREYLDAAVQAKFAILFISSDALDVANQYISITQEAVILFHLNYNRMFLDVNTVYKVGALLKDIPGFNYTDKNGNIIADPDSCVCKIGGIPVLDISGRWTNKNSQIYKLIHGNRASNLAFDRDAFINSGLGKDMAEAMFLEYEYDDVRDPRLLKLLEDKGIKCEFHDKNSEQWITIVPLSAYENPGNKLPCMCIFQEVNKFDPHQAITAFSYYYEFLNIAAQGECMLLFFAQESFDANDLLHEILKDAEKQYPLDRSRIYIAGHSHNGYFAAEYMRRHQREIAALASLGNEPGLLMPEVTSGFFRITDEQVEIQASVDTPTIIITGLNENNAKFPLHSDPPFVPPGQWVALNTFEKRAISWQRRLRSARCPGKTIEEIAATKNSADYVERQLGIPADKTEVLFLDGSENYIADIKNVDGKYHLRIVALGNMPHTVTPTMIKLAWSFLRRFARDQETGECIELY
jgi:pimeloyl-ACP methyl ester carboxylesterase